MTFNERELKLGMATIGVLLLGLLYVVLEGQWTSLQESREQAGLLDKKLAKLERLYSQQGRMTDEFNQLMTILPMYPEQKDVTADSLKEVQRLATLSKLSLRSLEPDKERRIGSLELYELSITCNWQGSLEALVTFMAHLQARGAVMDMRSINVAPVPKLKGQLKGSFTVDTAFSRGDRPQKVVPDHPVPVSPAPDQTPSTSTDA